VRRVIYRPSRSSQITQKLAALDPATRPYVFRLIEEPDAEPAGLAALPLATQALILETAIDFHQFHLADKPEGADPARRALLRALLLRRARLRWREAPPPFAPQSSPPEQGHGPARIQAGAGGADGGHGFVELRAQPSFHDLLAREEGFADNTQINLSQLRLRYETGPARWRLERFALADIVSLLPLTAWVRQPSWKVRFGWERNRDLGCDDCTPFVAVGGVGLTVETQAPLRVTAFAMADLDVEIGPAFAQDYRAGIGASAGVLVEPVRAWRIALSGGYTDFRSGQPGIVRRASLQQRVSLGRDVELRLEWNGVAAYREAMVGMAWTY
jgi:hypothetical protein